MQTISPQFIKTDDNHELYDSENVSYTHPNALETRKKHCERDYEKRVKKKTH